MLVAVMQFLILILVIRAVYYLCKLYMLDNPLWQKVKSFFNNHFEIVE